MRLNKKKISFMYSILKYRWYFSTYIKCIYQSVQASITPKKKKKSVYPCLWKIIMEMNADKEAMERK